MNHHKHAGRVLESNNCGMFTVLDKPRNEHGEYLVQFHESGHQEYKHISAINKGAVRDSSQDEPVSAGEDSGAIYIVRMKGTDYFKVGYTSGTVQTRMKQLQVGNPKPLKFVTTWGGDMDAEKEVHDMLGEFRTKGEWFELTTEDLLNVLPDIIA